jgi:hypothetical protein
VLYDVQVSTRLSALRAGGAAQTGASMSASRSRRFDDTRPGSRPAPHTRVPQVRLCQGSVRECISINCHPQTAAIIVILLFCSCNKQKTQVLYLDCASFKHKCAAFSWRNVEYSCMLTRSIYFVDGLLQWPAIAVAPHVHTHLMQARSASPKYLASLFTSISGRFSLTIFLIPNIFCVYRVCACLSAE